MRVTITGPGSRQTVLGAPSTVRATERVLSFGPRSTTRVRRAVSCRAAEPVVVSPRSAESRAVFSSSPAIRAVSRASASCTA